MIKIKKQVHSTDIVTVWYAEKTIDDDGIIQYREAKFKDGDTEDFYTLLTDLTESEDQIKAHFTKGCRYEVNRAYRENVNFVIKSGADISDKELDGFLDFFKEFWLSKDMTPPDMDSLREEMKAYRDNGYLVISHADIDNEISVYHTLLMDDNNARLLHSASLFRLKTDLEGGTRKIIGMANRALHFEEMKYFKDKGLRCYDWGGAGKGEDVRSITEFKESFGGTPVTYYDFDQTNGIKAKMINSLSEIKHKIKG